MTPENSTDSFNVDEDEDSIPNNHFGSSFSDDENNFLLPQKFNRDEDGKQQESSKKNSFSIDNILGLDNRRIKRNESEKYFIRPIPLLATSQEISAFNLNNKKRDKFYNGSQSLAINLQSANNTEIPTPSSVSSQNGGYLYANWIELQKTNMGHQGNFLFGYHGTIKMSLNLKYF